MGGDGAYNRSPILLESSVPLSCIALQAASRRARLDLATAGPIGFGLARGMNLLTRCSAA